LQQKRQKPYSPDILIMLAECLESQGKKINNFSLFSLIAVVVLNP